MKIGEPRIEQLMQIINGLDDEACIKFSNNTGKFYLSTEIFVKWAHGGKCYGNIVSHEYTIEDCIRNSYKIMQGKILKIEKNKEIKCAKFPTLIK